MAFELKELSKKMNCEAILNESIPIIFLGLSIGTLKQIVSSQSKLCHKIKELKKIINDEYMQEVLRVNDFSGESISKKVLYWFIRNKFVLLCYLIVAIRNSL